MTDVTTETVPCLDEALIRERLRRARFARLAYVDGEQPVVVPVNIVSDETQHVMLRTAAESALARLDGRRVSVEIDGHDSATRSGWSVLVRGVARDATDAADVAARRWQQITVDTWAPGVRDRLIVVLPLSITGRVIPTNADSDWFAGVPGS
jgi:nitroimidazol reductase NimA-like FMN-containing flavoprotein (pyridoxamine 5'-phosphate oxidase superfamily)